MADNVTLNLGSQDGSILATDDVTDAGGAHYQRVKLTDGTANSSTVIASGNGLAANALSVSIASDSTGQVKLAAGSAAIGEVSLETTPTANLATIAGDTTTIAGLDFATQTTLATIDADTGAIKTAVEGTLTVQISDTSFAVAENSALGEGILIQGDDGTDRKNINVDATTGNIQTDVISSALPTGAATAANQSTIAGHVDGIETLLGTIDADTGAIKTAVELIDNAISGSEMQVDVVTSVLPTGAATETTLATIDTDTGNIATNTTNIPNVIGTDGAAGPTSTLSVGGTESGGNIQEVRVDADGHLQVDVLSGGGAGTEYVMGTQTYLEGTTVGNIAAAVRYDAGGTLVNTDNELAPLQVNSSGELRVSGGGGGTQYTEDEISAVAPVGTATILKRDDTPSTIGADNDNVALRGTQYGAAYTQIVSSTGSFVDTFGGGTQYTEGDTDATVTGTAAMMEVAADTLQPVQGTVADGLLVNLGTNNDVTVSGVATEAKQPALGTAGSAASDVISVQGIAGGTTLPVSGTVTANPASGTITTVSTVTNLSQMGGVAITRGNGASDTGVQRVTIADDSTGVVGVTGAALTALQLIDNSIVAHDAAISGATGLNVAGVRATNNIEGATQVINNDVTHVAADLNGALVTRNATTLEELITGAVDSDTSGAEVTVTQFAAGAAGVHNYITSVTVTNQHASTNGIVTLRDGASGAAMWIFPAPATGGATHNFDPPLKQATDATGLFWIASAAITTINVSINGFQAQG